MLSFAIPKLAAGPLRLLLEDPTLWNTTDALSFGESLRTLGPVVLFGKMKPRFVSRPTQNGEDEAECPVEKSQK